MKYLSKTVNGADTRNKFLRSMDIAHAYDPETARMNYENEWFSSTKKQYLNTAFKQILENQMFWPKRILPDMLDEILMANMDQYPDMVKDVDDLKSKFLIWSSKRKNQPMTNQDIQKSIKSFEAKYKYACPETFRSAWMNNGAYITLSYGIKYEGITFPGMTQEQSLSKLKALALQIVADMNHEVDDRLFNICHYLYLGRVVKQ